ncbi:MAG: hypothetical protein JF592_01545 [Microbacterium sp.]|uniref:hypothetical protein n=1 Tax=Microbacterium sp. TaxID=51671 RepID=UPI001D31CCD1|nr:hypothetical protein [Microbacterium sp.]MBW8761251.1 hypothetical protein [Microbacterium sp.]
MDAALDDELRVLRARAYGPAADIAGDPAAAMRLRELEDLRAQAQSGVQIETAPPPLAEEASDAAAGAAIATVPLVDAPLAHGPVLVEQEGEHPITGSRSFLLRHRRALWLSSVVASAAAAAAITYAAVSFSPVTVSSNAPQIATLTPSPLSEIPIGFFGLTEDSPVWDFHGLTFFVGASGLNGAVGNPCLNVFETDQLPTAEEVSSGSYGYGGISFSACQAGAFPATIEMPLDGPAGDIVPSALRTQFPEGKALQFVLDGDRIGVFLDSGD